MTNSILEEQNACGADKKGKVSVPENTYKDPAQILQDDRLSWDEKMVALENWESDEKAMFVADDENMTVIRRVGEHNASRMLKEIQSAKQTLKEPPSPIDETIKQECSVLMALVGMNLDACTFYHHAGRYTQSPEQKMSFFALEKLHRRVVADLHHALQRKGNTEVAEAESLYDTQYRVFEKLCEKSFISSSIDTIIVIGQAENSCYETMKSILMDEKAVSTASRFHLSCAVHTLKRCSSHIYSLDRGADDLK